jgi:long-chain acyl-CoA synthetase
VPGSGARLYLGHDGQSQGRNPDPPQRVIQRASGEYTTRPTDKVYCVLPISHIVGFSVILIASLMAGATVQLVPRFDPAALVAAIANGGITLIFGVPATYQRLLEYKVIAGIDKLPRGKLRRLAVAGAPLDVTLKSKIEAELGLPLRNGYGITECAPAIAAVQAEAPRSDDAEAR